MINIKAKVEIIKDRHSYILAYPVIDNPGFWSNPFKILNRYSIIAINRLDGEPMKCDLCNSNAIHDCVFAFISKRRAKNKKIDSWKKMCYNCCRMYINIMPLLNEETKALCYMFILIIGLRQRI